MARVPGVGSLRIRVLGGFRLEHRGAEIDLGPKAATRALDVLRALILARDHACALVDLHEWLWPDADGDRAKAACDQAIHRLRRRLGVPGAIVQRDGLLLLRQAWLDLDDWTADATRALQVGRPDGEAEMRRGFERFAGPPFGSAALATWAIPSLERVRGLFLELAGRLGRRLEARNDVAGAHAVYLHALDLYPTSERCYAGLIRSRLAEGDGAAAFDDYRRCARVLQAAREIAPSPALTALVAPLLPRASRVG